MNTNHTLHRYRNAVRRERFSAFLRAVFGTVNPGTTFLPNWHIDLLGEYLEALRKREIKRLIINIPPRSLKSLTVSVAWPAWLLGQNPAERILVASYAAPLALKHAQDCRLVMQRSWYKEVFPDTRLTRGENEKHKFVTTERGFRLATSVGGTVTGEGGNILIVDDPLNPLQALSHTQRDASNHWFEHTFATRLDDKQKGVMVTVMQRLHPDDLSGFLLQKRGWEHLCLPAVAPAQKTYSFGAVSHVRKAGDILHPLREDNALIEQAKHDLGSMAFAAQYQQHPLPPKGGMVELGWFGRFDLGINN
jgi:hypothetical protein